MYFKRRPEDEGKQHAFTGIYNWFTEQPISTRAKQFAVGYTAAARALEGNFLGAIGAIRYWPRNTTRRYTSLRRGRRTRQRRRYTKSRITKRIRGYRTSRGYSKGRKSYARRTRKKRIPYWQWKKLQLLKKQGKYHGSHNPEKTIPKSRSGWKEIDRAFQPDFVGPRKRYNPNWDQYLYPFTTI